MLKLKPKTIKIKAEILTPIYIANNEVMDRLDYFFSPKNDEEKLWEVDRQWLFDLGKKDLSFLKRITTSIIRGDFKSLEEIKREIIDKQILNIEKYKIRELKVDTKAFRSLDNLGNKNNQGEIKRFTRLGLNKDLTIPGSTLKGLFRTIFLNDLIEKNDNFYKQVRNLENVDKSDDFKKDLFAFVAFEDVDISNCNNFVKIQEVKGKTKPKKFWNPGGWPPQIVEVLQKWEFQIIINDSKWQLDISVLEKKIKDYSTILIAREEQVLDNVRIESDFIDKLDNNYNQWIYPLKIGMFKKSLSYKLFWEEMIEDLNKIKGKEWQVQSRKKGIGDKTIYLDEQQNPLGWIGLSDIQFLEN